MACLVKGSRNVSDFARTAVLESIETQTGPGMLVQNRLTTLDTKVTELGATVQSLSELLKGTLRGTAQVPRRDFGPTAGCPDQAQRPATSE